MENYKVVLAAPIKTVVPVIKVVGNSCNMRCGYCFYHTEDQGIGSRMELDLLEKFIGEYLSIFHGDVCFNWHGGEPLLAGMNFFEKIVEYEYLYRTQHSTIHNTVQTNGVLLNSEWAAFFKEHNFGVGVSIDGNKENHDLFRKATGEASVFQATLSGIEILRRHGIEPGIIQTVTHSSVKYIKETFGFFAHELKCKHLGVNFFLDPNNLNPDMIGESLTNEDFVELFSTYFEQWIEEDNAEFSVRELDNFICGVVGKRTTSCNWNGGCAAFICVDFNGDVYASCDRMSCRSDVIIGDIKKQHLLEILNGEKRLSYLKLVNKVPDDCILCEWLNACRNGCAADREESPGGKYLLCSGRQILFERIRDRLLEIKIIKKGGERVWLGDHNVVIPQLSVAP